MLVASHHLLCLLVGVWRRKDVEIKRYGVRKQSPSAEATRRSMIACNLARYHGRPNICHREVMCRLDLRWTVIVQLDGTTIG